MEKKNIELKISPVVLDDAKKPSIRREKFLRLSRNTYSKSMNYIRSCMITFLTC